MPFFGFKITGSGSAWTAAGTNDAAKEITVDAGEIDAVIKSLKTAVKATEAGTPIQVGGGMVTPKCYVIGINLGAPAGGGGGGAAAEAAAPAPESESEEEMEMGLFD